MTYKSTFKFLIFLIPFAPFGVGIAVGALPTIDLPRLFCMFLLIAFFLNQPVVSEKNGVDSIWLKLFMLFQFFSVLIAPSILNSLILFIGNCIVYYSIYFIALRTFDSVDYIYKCIDILKLLLLALAIFAVIEFVTGTNIFDPYRTAYLVRENSRFNDALGRLGIKASMGPYASSLPFAYMLSSLLFLVLIKTRSKFFNSKLFVVTTMSIGIFAIISTQSRAAYGSVVLGSILYAVLKYKFNPFYVFGFLALLGLVVYFVFQNFFENDYIVQFILKINESKQYDDGAGTRLSDNLTDLRAVFNAPVLGHGFGSVVYFRSVGSNLKATLGTSDTSLYLTFALESGVFALIALILFFVRPLKLALSKAFSSSSYKHTYLVLFVSIFVFLFNLLSAYRFESSFVLFLLVAMVPTLKRFEVSQKSPNPSI